MKGAFLLKIFIDQGHNPQNPNAGAEGFGLKEQDINFKIGILLAELLSANPDYQVKLSRPTAQTQLGTSNSTSLAARVNAANEWGADYFISLHTNASEISSASGSEAFAYARNSQAFTLGENILYWLNQITGLQNRGMKIRPSLYVLKKTRMPAVLVELGFISNYYDATLMNTQPELFAQGVYYGILDYMELL